MSKLSNLSKSARGKQPAGTSDPEANKALEKLWKTYNVDGIKCIYRQFSDIFAKKNNLHRRYLQITINSFSIEIVIKIAKGSHRTDYNYALITPDFIKNATPEEDYPDMLDKLNNKIKLSEQSNK